MQRVFDGLLSKVRSKLQQITTGISSRVKSTVSILNWEDDSNESKRAFYLLSLMLLISVIFLSPDKLAQTFSPIQTETEILEKVEEIAKIVKKLVYDLG